MRLAASLAIDRKTINQALTLGHSKLTGSIVPEGFEYYWPTPAPVYDPAKAKKLLAEAGHPNGFDAGEYYCDSTYSNLAEAVINNLQAIGIRAKLRPLERAAFFKGYSEKSYKNIIQGASGAFGNTATRLETFVVKGAPTSTATIPTSTRCSSSRRPSSTPRSGKRSCTRRSSSCTSARSTRTSGSWPSSTAPVPASGSRGSA